MFWLGLIHDDVINWKQFPLYWPFVRGIHRSPVNSPHKGRWRGVLMFSLICTWINAWVNNRKAGDLRRNRAHYDVTVMFMLKSIRYHRDLVPKLWQLLPCHWTMLQAHLHRQTWKPSQDEVNAMIYYNPACTEIYDTLHWRHNELDGVSNHQPHNCLHNRLFRHRSKKISMLRVAGLCEGNSPVTGEFPAQKASNAENVSIWWRPHDTCDFRQRLNKL